jgi:predicted ArsR family transcriptional regulator
MAFRDLLTATGEALVFVATTERPTVEDIARAADVTQDHALRILKQLRADGYLDWDQPHGKAGRNRYEIHWDKKLPDREITVRQFICALETKQS